MFERDGCDHQRVLCLKGTGVTTNAWTLFNDIVPQGGVPAAWKEAASVLSEALLTSFPCVGTHVMCIARNYHIHSY